MWEDDDTKNKMFRLQWFYRPEDTAQGRQAHHKDNELYLSRFMDDNPLESFHGPAFVEFVPKFPPPATTMPKFVCRQKYHNERYIKLTEKQLRTYQQGQHGSCFPCARLARGGGKCCVGLTGLACTVRVCVQGVGSKHPTPAPTTTTICQRWRWRRRRTKPGARTEGTMRTSPVLMWTRSWMCLPLMDRSRRLCFLLCKPRTTLCTRATSELEAASRYCSTRGQTVRCHARTPLTTCLRPWY